MLLTIDVGNTNIVFGLLEEGTMLSQRRRETHDGASRADYEADMIAVLAGRIPEGAILSSVAPEVNEALAAAAEKITGKKCLVVSSDMALDMPLRVEKPATVGADIIAGCVGAKEHYPLPLAVADLGTANTVMVVDRAGAYVGGIIAPGLKMQLKSLGAGTSLLPNLEVSAPEKVIGANTVDCLESGVVYGTAAMLDGIVERMEEELGEKLTVVACGGLSGLVAPLCRHEVVYDPDLLLKGLAAIYEKNQ